MRGAAVLGGVVLALAGLFFFQYSIEHGLIPPWLRVLVGTAVGLGCVVGAELRARRRYEVLANGLVGGGIVVLYAAFWAASARYQLVPLAAGFALMVSVTGACTALAHRHASLVIAMIGLIGGFATPFLLSTGENRPIALFSYLLLLDAGLLFVARQRGWPLLALVSLAGTLLYQGAWIVGRMEGHQIALAIGILAVFSAVFAAALRSQPAESRRLVLVTQGGAVIFPFAFALHLAANADLGPHFYPLGILLIALSTSACWLGRKACPESANENALIPGASSAASRPGPRRSSMMSCRSAAVAQPAPKATSSAVVPLTCGTPHRSRVIVTPLRGRSVRTARSPPRPRVSRLK